MTGALEGMDEGVNVWRGLVGRRTVVVCYLHRGVIDLLAAILDEQRLLIEQYDCRWLILEILNDIVMIDLPRHAL